jgi:hypothetical protein
VPLTQSECGGVQRSSSGRRGHARNRRPAVGPGKKPQRSNRYATLARRGPRAGPSPNDRETRHDHDVANRMERTMQPPPLDPPVSDTAPSDGTVTSYDERRFVTYLRLLDAERDRADWQEAAKIVLHIDLSREPERAPCVGKPPSPRTVDDRERPSPSAARRNAPMSLGSWSCPDARFRVQTGARAAMKSPGRTKRPGLHFPNCEGASGRSPSRGYWGRILNGYQIGEVERQRPQLTRLPRSQSVRPLPLA